MGKKYYLIVALLIALSLCACNTETPDNLSVATEPIVEPSTAPTESTSETEIVADPEWFSKDVIAEALSYVFITEGNMNIAKAQELLLPLVEANDPEAQYYWGYILDCVSYEDSREGLYWYQHSAEQGFSKAHLAIAFNDHTEDPEVYLEKAREAGVMDMPPEELGPDGNELLGLVHYFDENYETAMEYFLVAAEMGSAKAMNNIGMLYYYGLGVEKDLKMIEYWLTKAADLGDGCAMFNLGYMHFDYSSYYDEILFRKYEDKVDDWFTAAEAGDGTAMHNLGAMYYFGLGGVTADDKLAAEWYQKGADAGSPEAMYELAHMYSWGFGVEQNSELAEEWNEKYIEAMKSSPEKDPELFDYYAEKEAMEAIMVDWFQKSANTGYSTGVYYLGYAYNHGYVSGYIEVDNAIKWYEKAASQGYTDAMMAMARLYKEGYWDGSGKRISDYDQAMEWFIKAYVNGETSALEEINELLSEGYGANAYFEHYGELIHASS